MPRSPKRLILSAAACAEDDKAEPPRELDLFLECRAHGTLYEAGGLADQPAALWVQMNAAYSIWKAMKGWHEARNRITWSSEHPREWQNVQLVLRLREAEKQHSD